jgi:hypothetical protein
MKFFGWRVAFVPGNSDGRSEYGAKAYIRAYQTAATLLYGRQRSLRVHGVFKVSSLTALFFGLYLLLMGTEGLGGRVSGTVRQKFDRALRPWRPSIGGCFFAAGDRPGVRALTGLTGRFA